MSGQMLEAYRDHKDGITYYPDVQMSTYIWPKLKYDELAIK